MTEELIDIIYAYRDRDVRHIRTSLESLKNQEDQRFRVTFVDYGSNDIYSREAEATCREFPFCSYYYVNARGKMWNRGDALNHGMLLTKGHDLFLSDIDMVFRKGFISQLHSLTQSGAVHFFPVGYLDARNTKKITSKPGSPVSFRKSEPFASGMLLASRKTMNAVNGYNTFYSLWGLEDNDLKKRVEQSGIKCQQVQDVWMYHQYHAPVPGSGQLPEGWIQLMKDYFENKKDRQFSGLAQSISLFGRPAVDQWNSGKLQFTEIRARKLFLRYQLLSAVANPGTYAFNILSIVPQHPGWIQKKGPALGRFLRRLGLHAEIRSPYEDQYLSMAEIRAEIYFTVKLLSNRLADYYIQEEKDNLKVLFICR